MAKTGAKVVAPVKARTGDNRPNGKATKQHPKTNKKSGNSCCGYSIKRTDRAGHDQGHRKLTQAA
jgi:hypothetical protein